MRNIFLSVFLVLFFTISSASAALYPAGYGVSSSGCTNSAEISPLSPLPNATVSVLKTVTFFVSNSVKEIAVRINGYNATDILLVPSDVLGKRKYVALVPVEAVSAETKISILAETSSGCTDSSVFYVRKEAATPSSECSLSVGPQAIVQGESAQLSWNTRYAKKVFLGTSEVDLSGTMWVSPAQTTEYRVVTWGPGGVSKCTTMLYVRQKIKKIPYCSLRLSSERVLAGENTTLSWTAENATKAWLLGKKVSPANGSQVISSLVSRKYTLIVAGDDGANYCRTHLRVENP